MALYPPHWFEDFSVGDVFETGQFSFSESSIIDYAFTWDPQPFHLDKEYADASIFGGLIASGFQTFGVTFRLLLQTGAFGRNQGGRGIDELRWPSPVRPGDTIHATITITSVKPARTTGHVNADVVTVNQDGVPVLTVKMTYIIPKTPREAPSA